MMNTQAFADFGTQFLATLAGRLDELSRTLDTAPPDLTRDDGRELAQAVADAFATGTGILTMRPDGRGLARVSPHGVTLNINTRGDLGRLDHFEVAGRDLRPGDRLDGGQVADGTGLTVDKVLTPENPDDETLTVLLVDGRPFVIDPDRRFRIRRP